jgi:hypothetical protein
MDGPQPEIWTLLVFITIIRPSMSSEILEQYYATLPINVSPDVSPSSPSGIQPTIGLIGMGAMGRMYAKYLGDAGWCR